MNRSWSAVAAGITALVWGAGCSPVDVPASDTVMVLAAREYAYGDFEHYLEVNSLDGEVGLPSAVLTGLFDQFILEELLVELARDEGLGDGDRRVVIERLVSRRVASEVDSAAIELYYSEHPEEFRQPEQVDLRQLLVEQRPAAEAALARLRAGEAFEAVAIDVEGEEARGGWVQRGMTRDSLPPDFASAIFAIAPGEVSEIVETDYGFLLFEVLARHEAHDLTLQEASPRIREQLEREAADRALAVLVEEAAGRYNVEVFEQNLPFDYLGTYRSERTSR